MADWGPSFAERYDSVSTAAASDSSVSSDVSPNTKGAWEYVNTDTTLGGAGIFITFKGYGAPSDDVRTLLLDVGLDAQNGGPILLPNLLVCLPKSTAYDFPASFLYVPIQVPAGYSLDARAQSSAGSDSVFMDVRLINSPVPGIGAVMDAYGVIDSGDTAGTVADYNAGAPGEYGTWVELSASCQRAKVLLVAVGYDNAASGSEESYSYRFQLGVGAAGYEVPVLSGCGSIAYGSFLPGPRFHGPYYLDLPAGSRIAVRLYRAPDGDVHTLSFAAYGIR